MTEERRGRREEGGRRDDRPRFEGNRGGDGQRSDRPKIERPQRQNEGERPLDSNGKKTLNYKGCPKDSLFLLT